MYNIDNRCPPIELPVTAPNDPKKVTRRLFRSGPRYLEGTFSLIAKAAERQSLWQRAIREPGHNAAVAKQLLSCRAELAKLTADARQRGHSVPIGRQQEEAGAVSGCSYAEFVLDGYLASAIGSAAAARKFCAAAEISLRAASVEEAKWIGKSVKSSDMDEVAGGWELPWNVSWFVSKGSTEAARRLKERHNLDSNMEIPAAFAYWPCEWHPCNMWSRRCAEVKILEGAGRATVLVGNCEHTNQKYVNRRTFCGRRPVNLRVCSQ